MEVAHGEVLSVGGDKGCTLGLRSGSDDGVRKQDPRARAVLSPVRAGNLGNPAVNRELLKTGEERTQGPLLACAQPGMELRCGDHRTAEAFTCLNTAGQEISRLTMTAQVIDKHICVHEPPGHQRDSLIP